MTERISTSLAAASVLLVILAVAVAARASDLNWLYLGSFAIALGAVGAFFALRSRKWLVAAINLVAAVAGIWMVIAIATFEGS